MSHDNDNWVGISELPAYNPFMFEIARHIRGESVSYVSVANKIPAKKIKAIEKGDHVPNLKDAERLAYWYHFPISFFEQWWDTELDCTGFYGKSVPIDYMKYKVFRELNPKFNRMQAHFPEPIKEQAKIIQFKNKQP